MGWFMGMEGAPAFVKNDAVAAFFVGLLLLLLLFIVVKCELVIELW